jgi:hypothetical protein
LVAVRLSSSESVSVGNSLGMVPKTNMDGTRPFGFATSFRAFTV